MDTPLGKAECQHCHELTPESELLIVRVYGSSSVICDPCYYAQLGQKQEFDSVDYLFPREKVPNKAK